MSVVDIGCHLRRETGISAYSGRADQSHPPGPLLPCALRNMMHESCQFIVKSIAIFILEVDGVEKLAVIIVPFY